VEKGGRLEGWRVGCLARNLDKPEKPEKPDKLKKLKIRNKPDKPNTTR